MTLFDPAWKKLVERSPPWFATAVMDWDSSVVQWLARADVPRNGYDLCRSYVYGLVALNLYRLTGAWSDWGANFLVVQTPNAEKLIPQRFKGALLNSVTALWGEALYRAAYRERGLPQGREPRDGKTPETAFVISGATDNKLAVAGILRIATQSEFTPRTVRTLKHAGKSLLVVEITYTPLLSPPEEHAFHFHIEDGELPSADADEYDLIKFRGTFMGI